MFAFLLTTIALAAPQAAPAATDAAPRGLVRSADGACEGYTLFAPLRATSTYLVDMQGEVVHEWPSDLTPGNSVYLLDDGTLLRCGRVANDLFHGGGQGGRIRQLAWDGTVLWDLDWSNDEVMHHHDVEPLPNGNVLVISWEHRTAAEALAAGRDPEHVSDEQGFWPDALFELKPVLPDGAEVVWEWHAWDHLIQDRTPDAAGYGDVTAHPERIDVNGDHRDQPPLGAAELAEQAELLRRMKDVGYVGDDDEPVDAPQNAPGDAGGDWMHTNSVDYHAGLDLIAISVRTFDEVWIIDHSTTSAEAATSRGGRYGRGGDLLYRWGNPRTYGAGDAAERRLFDQHDAQWVPDDCPGAGNLLVFNNGRGRPTPFSSVDEIELPYGDDAFERTGAAFGPDGPVWSYTASERESFYASFISGTQRLPNGNTLICSGPTGRAFEVTRDGTVVWEYLNPFGGEAEADGGPERGGPPMDGGRPDRNRGRRPNGPPPDGATPDSAGDRRRPRDGRGPQGDGGGRPQRGGGPGPNALFRAIRIPLDHPGLANLR